MRMTEQAHDIITLQELNYTEELPETHFTLEENAIEKARFVYHLFHQDCFAEDTGLEVQALGGAPGVFSARYGGEEKNPKKNIERLLNEMKNESVRRARFRTVIALIINGEEHIFQGEVTGVILKEQIGAGGFGYDPVFQPDGYDKSFAEMSKEEKDNISHRAAAFQRMKEFLRK